MNDPHILKEPQMSKETQRTDKPQILKDDQISNEMQNPNKLKTMN
jgi:hypothetical protein